MAEKEVYGSSQQDGPNEAHLPISDQIRMAYGRIIHEHQRLFTAKRYIASEEETAMMENLDEYMAAKNSDQRRAVILEALKDNVSYHETVSGISLIEERLKIEELNRDMLRLLVEAAKAPGATY